MTKGHEEASCGVCPDGITIDLQLEILSWVPASSVVHLRSVCKAWNEFTRNDYFVEKHLARSIHLQNNSFSTNFYLSPRKKIHNDELNVMLELVGDDKHRAITSRHPISSVPISGLLSSNGLLCMILHNLNVCFINPTTNKRLNLHRPVLFDIKDITNLVFGFDDKKKEYKLVCEVLFYHTRKSSVVVCGIPKHGPPQPWRLIPDTSEKGLDIGGNTSYSCNNPPVVVNGLFHWVKLTVPDMPDLPTFLSGKLQHYCDYENVTIKSFDLHHEKFNTISITKVHRPTFYLWDENKLAVVEVEGCLGLVVLSQFGTVELWKLVEYGNHDSWVQMFCMYSEVFLSLPIRSNYSCGPYFLWKGDQLFICYGKRIISCNPKTNQCLLRFEADDSEADDILHNIITTPFVSSLVSPGAFSEHVPIVY